MSIVQRSLCLEQLESRLNPSGAISLVTQADPSLPSDSAGGASSFPVGPSNFISADGRYTVYTCTAANLTAGQIDTNNATDVFVYDKVLNTNTLVSHAVGAPLAAGDGPSQALTISADGRYVVFTSNAQDLVAGFVDNNGQTPDLFLYDNLSGATRLVSHSTIGMNVGQTGPLLGFAELVTVAYISAHGEVVAYSSEGSDLVPNFVNPGGNPQAYFFDATTGTNTLLSHSSVSLTTAISTEGYVGGVSDDGQRILYDTKSVLVFDRPTETSILISHKYNAPTVADNGGGQAISADGTKVLFNTIATDIVAGFVDNNGKSQADCYFCDLNTGVVSLVTHSSASMTAGSNVDIDQPPVMSADGSTIVFVTKATNLVSGFAAGKANVDNVYAYSAATGAIVLVSRSTGTTATGATDASSEASVSGDGQTITYASPATDLVSGYVDGNGTQTGNMLVLYDVYAFDMNSATSRLVSHTPVGALHGGNNRSWEPSVSRDGSVIAFSSSSNNLLSSQFDGNGQPDIFLFATGTGVVSLASVRGGAISASAGGEDSNNWSNWVQQSADGRFIVYVSDAINLVPGQVDTNGGNDVFVYDRVTNTTQLVSRAYSQPAQTANDVSSTPEISADGRYVAYSSLATDLVPGFVDDNDAPGMTHYNADIFLFDRLTGTNELVSRQAGTTVDGSNLMTGSESPDYLFNLSISDDGQYLAYVSYATNLVAGYQTGNPGGGYNIYLFDRVAGTNTLVTHDADSLLTSGNDNSYKPTMSGDGRYIAYFGEATNLVAGMPADSGSNTFLYDCQTGMTVLVSHAFGSASIGGDGGSDEAFVDRDGNFVCFESASNNLIAGADDPNNGSDVFLYNVATGQNILVSHLVNSPNTSGDSQSFVEAYPGTVISDDGRYVAFHSDADNLVDGFVDNDGSDADGTVGYDTFLYDRVADKTVLVSHSTDSLVASGDQESYDPTISGNGRFVTYTSQGDNLTNVGNPDGGPQSYVFDLLTSNTTLLSHTADGKAGNTQLGSFDAWINEDGSVVIFASASDDLVPNDFNGFADLFAYVTPPAKVQSLQIADGSAQRSIVRSLTITFDQPVTFAGDPTAAFEVSRVGSGDVSLNVNMSADGTTATVTFSGPLTQFGSLIDGNYQLTIHADQVTGYIGNLDGDGDGVAGGAYTATFFRLFGDANGDRHVDAADFLAFRLSLLQPSTIFDYDSNGTVDAADFLQFRLRFLTVI